MKSKYKALAAVLLCTALILAGCSCHFQRDKDKDKINIAVIVKSTTSDFWNNVSNGVNSAATEYNVSVTFDGPDNEEDYSTQNKMLEKAIENRVDAIVFSAIDYYKSSELINKAASMGIKVITVDSGVDSNKVDMFIGTDNYAAGKNAAQEAIKGFSENEKICIGIVNYNQSTDNGQRREAGFRDYIEGIENAEVTAVVNVDSNVESAQAGASSLLSKYPQINVMVTFNEWTTLGVGKSIKQLGLKDKVKVIGFDSNVVSIGMLETGEMDVLLVQNPFAMGYLGVKYASDLVSEKAVQSQVYTSTAVVTKENMYNKDIQKILFRFK